MQLCRTLITDLHQLQSWQDRWQALTNSMDGNVDFFASSAFTYAYFHHYAPEDASSLYAINAKS